MDNEELYDFFDKVNRHNTHINQLKKAGTDLIGDLKEQIIEANNKNFKVETSDGLCFRFIEWDFVFHVEIAVREINDYDAKLIMYEKQNINGEVIENITSIKYDFNEKKRINGDEDFNIVKVFFDFITRLFENTKGKPIKI